MQGDSTPEPTVLRLLPMSLEKRIERLERAANATGDHIPMVLVPYVADEAGQAVAQRQALERNPRRTERS